MDGMNVQLQRMRAVSTSWRLYARRSGWELNAVLSML